MLKPVEKSKSLICLKYGTSNFHIICARLQPGKFCGGRNASMAWADDATYEHIAK